MPSSNNLFPKIKLAPSVPEMLPFGIGAWAWGGDFYWSIGSKKVRFEDLTEAFPRMLDAGVTFFDTAEVYGFGRSERTLGRLVKQDPRPVVIASKFMPFPWRSSIAFRRALKASLQRLGMDSIDLYQIHMPNQRVPIETLMSLMSDAVEDGLIRAVGVSNYSVAQTKQAAAALAKRGLRLASNQVLYNLIDRGPEFSGLLELCAKEDIKVIAYSPLAQGILTGKYNPQNPLPGLRGMRTSKTRLQSLQGLVDALREISAVHQRTPAQAALNWTLCKGTIPIPGVKNLRQTEENLGALGWKLSPEEIETLDQASERCR